MQHLTTALRFLALSLVAAGALACQTIQDPLDAQGDFKELQKQFTQYIRWGNIEDASTFVVEDQRDAFLEMAPDLTDIRFTSYEILAVTYDDEAATVDVKYTGYRLSWPIEKTVKVRQEWSRETGPWRVRLELTKIRQALAMATP